MSDHIYGLEEVRDGIKTIVDEVGADFVYSPPADAGSCLYVHHGQPVGTAGCLIGRYLGSIGVPVDVLESMNARGEIELCHIELGDAGFKFSSEAYRWMGHAQDAQDVKATWGESVNRADQRMGLVEVDA